MRATGEKVADNAFEPSASLLKAILVAGASTMSGIAMRNSEKLSLYDVDQGFGRVDLSRSLPLKGVNDDGWSLQVCALIPLPGVVAQVGVWEYGCAHAHCCAPCSYPPSTKFDMSSLQFCLKKKQLQIS